VPNQFVDQLRRKAESRPAPPKGKGRGIVTAFGGQRAFTCGYVLLRLLREELGCELPIEVWHFGEGELTPTMRHLLKPLNVKLVDVRGVLDTFPADIHDGWQLKPYAILHSAFAEVLFLDSDQVPVGNPDRVFDWPEYRESGAIFWPDIQDFRRDNPIWNMLDLQPQDGASFETGQLLVDKRRHIASLALALALNERSETVYQHIYGDKDTFLMAWLMDGADYQFVPHRPFMTERVLVQRGFDGAPVFQHRTNAKWMYKGEQVNFEGEVHRAACHGYLADLAVAWNGQLFYPPDRSPRALEAERTIVEHGRFRAEFLGDREEVWEFLYPNEFGEGRSRNRRNWFVTEQEDQLVLLVVAHGQVTSRYTQEDNGSWNGMTIEKPGEGISLVALDTMALRNTDEAVSAASPLLDGVIEASGVSQFGSDNAHATLVETMVLLLRSQPSLRTPIQALLRRDDELRGIGESVLSRVPESESSAPHRRMDVFQKGYRDWRTGKL